MKSLSMFTSALFSLEGGGFDIPLKIKSTAEIDAGYHYKRPKGVHKNTSKYMPHQGAQECARRVRQQRVKDDKIILNTYSAV